MPISYMPARDTVPQYAVFGKIPDCSDFIRVGITSHPAVLEFDGIIARSLAYVSRQPDWNEETALRAGGSDFLFTTYDRRWCYFGTLLPSRDKAGRMYPLVAGAVLPIYAIAPAFVEIPIANELFFSGLRKALSDTVNTGDLHACQRFLDVWVVQNPHAQDDLELAKQLLMRHLASTSVARLQIALSDDRCPMLDDILLAFIFHADMLRHLGVSAQKQVIALPLSTKVGETALDQGMWLALYRAAMGKEKNRFPDFISKNDDRHTLTLASGRLGDRCLGALWDMKNDPASILDAGDTHTPWAQHRAWADTAYNLGRQAQNPNLDISSLVSIVERIAVNVS